MLRSLFLLALFVGMPLYGEEPTVGKPNAYVVVHGDIMGQNITAWAPTVTALLNSGRYGEVHGVFHGAELIPDQAAGATQYRGHALKDPLDGFVSHTYYDHEFTKTPAEAVTFGEALHYLRDIKGLNSTKEISDFLLSPEAATSLVPALRDSAGLIKRYADGLNAGSPDYESPKAVLREYLEDGGAQTVRHVLEMKALLANARAGDTLLVDFNFGESGFHYDEFRKDLTSRGVKILEVNVNEIGNIRENTVEEYGYRRITRLLSGPNQPLFDAGTAVTTEQVRAVYRAGRPAAQQSALDGQVKALFGSRDPKTGYDVFHLSANHPRLAWKTHGPHLLKLLETRLQSDSRPVVIPPFGVADSDVLKNGLEALKAKYPGQLLDASAIRDNVLLAELLKNSTRNVFSSDTGPAWLSRKMNPKGTHVFVPNLAQAMSPEARANPAGARAIEGKWASGEGTYHYISADGSDVAAAFAEIFSGEKAGEKTAPEVPATSPAVVAEIPPAPPEVQRRWFRAFIKRCLGK